MIAVIIIAPVFILGCALKNRSAWIAIVEPKVASNVKVASAIVFTLLDNTLFDNCDVFSLILLILTESLMLSKEGILEVIDNIF